VGAEKSQGLSCPAAGDEVSSSSPATAPPAPNNLKRIVAASLIGTTTEWYDDSFDQSYELRFCRH
jgi:hypothetical protein